MLKYRKNLRKVLKNIVQDRMIENKKKTDNTLLYCFQFDEPGTLEQEQIHGNLLPQEQSAVNEIIDLSKLIIEKVEDVFHKLDRINGSISYYDNKIFVDGCQVYSGNKQIPQQFITYAVQSYKQMVRLDNLNIMNSLLSRLSIMFFPLFKEDKISEFYIRVKKAHVDISADYQEYITNIENAFNNLTLKIEKHAINMLTCEKFVK
ncbi:hypothetical protein AB837_00443 [bacterium AB1]|nr:hypothetical protein AB837_00443 [bacterium AB1]